MAATDIQPSLREAIDDNIRRNISVVLDLARVKAPTIYRALDMSRQSFYNRLHGNSRFTAAETVIIAHMLGLTVELLADETAAVVKALETGNPSPLVALLSGVEIARTGSFSPELTALPDPTDSPTLFDEDLLPVDHWTRPFLTSV